MAAAEARAAWQRTVNRCFVQEDAKRAPKLACCQTSSSTSKQVESEPANPVDGPDHFATDNLMPLNRNPSYSTLPPVTRWWLHMEPSYRYQKGFTYEQLNAIETEVDNLGPDGFKSSKYPLDVHYGVEFKKQELKTLYSNNPKELLEIMEKKGNDEMLKSELHFESDSPWIGYEKPGPWWRTTDGDELANLVAQRSLEHIENCDLPVPSKGCVRRHPYAQRMSYDDNKALKSSLEINLQSGGISGLTFDGERHLDFGRTPKSQYSSIEQEDSPFGSEKSCSLTDHNDSSKTRKVSQGDNCKAELMEALCHSQTRAREAEKAAKQASAEKEHIVQLIFRQASQLFAYKQWVQLLQLETLYIQINNTDRPISTLFPVAPPWMACEGRKLRKSKQRFIDGKRAKRAQSEHDVGKYAVAFALGLSLIGAGLLLGWTVGLMFPPF